jgi:murein DD-endopeptidase MepM/ murein hydrolase activator NlpD
VKVFQFKHIIPLLSIIILFISSCSKEKITPVDLPTPDYDKFGFIRDSLEVISGKIKKNETLADILFETGIGYNTITKIYNDAKPLFDFKKIRPGRNYKIYKTADTLSSLHAFVYEINKIEYLKIVLKDSLDISLIKREVITKERIISGIINSSLYQTLQEQQASMVLAGDLAEVFAWQIDFYTIQKGDKFFAIYEELYADDKLVGVGEIIAAKFVHKNNPYFAYRFSQNDKIEYFDEEGKSLQKKFLKAPLKYNRISSHYSGSRLHPIYRVYRPHRGIDYAAAAGTSVQAVGDGIVIKVGRNGDAGKMVKLRHNSVYTSAYLHLSGYGKGIKSGAKVKQGDVIGYVGSTGASTGPHLDFRFWKNGSLVNYLTQKFPASKSVADSNFQQFNSLKDSLHYNLEQLSEDI